MSNQFAERKSIKAVILAGSRDFGRYPLASRLPPALWPLVGKPVLEHMLRHLSLEGINRVVVCTNGDSSMLWQSVAAKDYVKLEFLEEPLPVGTGGCIRDAAGDQTDALLLVFPAAMVCPPKVDALIRAHNDGQCDLTVVFHPDRTNGKFMSEAAGIYICETGVLEHIPREGYFDIKEGLIPEMLRVGKTVHTAVLPNHVGNFRERQGYLDAVARYLMSAPKLREDLKLREQTNLQGVWVAPNARVDASARIYGPVVIMDCARISKGVAIFGPTIFGRNVTVGKDSIVVNSILWDEARVGKDCHIQRCVADYHTVVRDGSVREEAVLFEPAGVLKGSVDALVAGARYNTSRLQSALKTQLHKISEKFANRLQLNRATIIPWLATSLVLIAFIWSYWPGIVDLWSVWRRSDEYSSGLLVPFLAVYVLWSRRLRLAQVEIKPCVWGLIAFLGAQALRLFGLFFMYSSAERLSVVLSIAALVLFLFGRRFFRGIVTLLLFLCLMLPWPIRVQAAVTLPAQRLATSSAVFCLEMAGYEVTQEGNVIHIGQATVAIAEACNGLRMITAFFAISGLVVLLIERAWWEKLIIIASSLPIGLLCNTVRLVITALAFTVLSSEHWEMTFHDFGGYAMMPLALATVIGELWLLTKLTTPSTEKIPAIITAHNADNRHKSESKED